MQKTILSLPEDLERIIAKILQQENSNEWIQGARLLHSRYMDDRINNKEIINGMRDALSYLALRLPATYSQSISAIDNVAEIIPSWMPKTMLDIGSGPGAGVIAAKEIFPSLEEAVCLDQNSDFISIGRKIFEELNMPINITWKKGDMTRGIGAEKPMYDLILVSNVLNEISPIQREKLLGFAYNHCSGILLIIEPGTPTGCGIVQTASVNFSHTSLVAPYIGNNIISRPDFWLHFSQKFTRPEFQRRVRQNMRDSSLMASDWEDSKYSYVAIGKIPAEVLPWGRCVGPVKLMNGYLEVPILTKDFLKEIKIMKRHRSQYIFAKKLKWGQIILREEDCIVSIVI
ncbi:MAG: methyltransferase domain-containing protein [Candidatus Levybacteria bacterium]|nr:methyltransferase domain-containing protein [Candidatus Levybacteria bacterium]